MGTQNDNNASDENIKEELAADGERSGVEEDTYLPYPFDAEKISISTKTMVLSNIVKRIERKLIRAAVIQRNENLWDNGKKSRLIESLMLRIPLPRFYAAVDKDDTLTIVDGLQRISVLKKYISEKAFALESLEFLKEFNGKKYDDLPDNMKIRIDETELDFAIINPDSPPEVQRNIFKRLNTGGLPLTDQEIRHALYYGPSTQFLKELVDTDDFNSAVDNRVNDSRMAAQELVLRFLAFSIFDIDGYRKNEEMDSFLSETMNIINRLRSAERQEPPSFNSNSRTIKNDDIETIKQKFFLAMKRAKELFDNCAFRITTPTKTKVGTYRSPINKSLFETWSILLSDMPEHDYEKLRDDRETLFKRIDDEFGDKESSLRRYIGEDSTKVIGVKGRYEIIGGIINKLIREKTL